MNKIQPSVLTFALGESLTTATQPGGAGTAIIPSVTTKYIDLSQLASIYNRRFYRQGLNWAVAGMKFLTSSQAPTGVNPTPNAAVLVSKVPNTWVANNAWTKGFKTWQEMNDKALNDAESSQGRFLDFKIYADAAHHTVGFGANWRPTAYTPGEWIPSEIIVPDSSSVAPATSAFEILAVGDNYPGLGSSGRDAVSLIQGYANSRALPMVSDPNTPGELTDASGLTPENWMTGITNEGLPQDSAVLADVVAYDQPPYPYENDGTHVTTMYPGGAIQGNYLEIHDQAVISGTTIGGVTRIKGGNFPCGLIKVVFANYTLEDVDVSAFIDLVPGKHRGYLAETMLEM